MVEPGMFFGGTIVWMDAARIVQTKVHVIIPVLYVVLRVVGGLKRFTYVLEGPASARRRARTRWRRGAAASTYPTVNV